MASFKTTITAGDKVNIHYIAGSCVHYLFTHKNVCEDCKQFLENGNGSFTTEETKLSECLDLGGLKKISSTTYRMFEETECVVQDNMSALLKTSISFNSIIKCIQEKYNTVFPQCCNILKCLLEHYVTVRGLGIKSFEICHQKKNRKLWL